MSIAVTVWGNRISPVFDSSSNLMIVNVKETGMVSRNIKPFDPQYPLGYMRLFRHYHVQVLICGAISHAHANMIKAGGIRLVSFVTGQIENVLALYREDPDQMGSVLMPGTSGEPQLNTDVS